jgi:predicted nuclease with TOPRIM domain
MVHHTIIALRKRVTELETENERQKQSIMELSSQNLILCESIEELREEKAQLKRKVFVLNSRGPRIKALQEG